MRLKSNIQLKLIFFTLFLLRNQSYAETTLSWDDCVKSAFKNNAELLISESELKSSNANETASHSGFFPHLQAAASFSNTTLGDSSRISGKSGLGSTSKSLDGKLKLTQNIFSGLSDYHLSKKAAYTLDASTNSYTLAKLKLWKDLKSTFATLLYAQKKVQLLETIAKRVKRNVELVKLRYERGRENKGSFFYNKASYSQALFEVEQSQRELTTAKKTLGQILNTSDENIILKGNLGPTATANKKYDFNKLALNSVQRNKSLAELNAAEHNAAIVFAGHLPSLDASYSLGKKGAGFYFERNYSEFEITLSIPIFSGLKTSSEVTQAVENKKINELNLEQTTLQTVVDLEAAYNHYVDAIQKLDVSKEMLNAVEIKAEIARNKYASGLLAYENWDDIENNLIQTQKDVLANKRDAMIAEAVWEQTSGKGPTL